MSGDNNSQMTVESAPLDLEVLKKQGRWQLRRLGQEVGLLSDEKKKMAFFGGSNDEMAAAILVELQRLRGKSGTKPAGNGTAAVAPPPPAQEQEAPPPAVEEKPARTPSYAGKKGAAANGEGGSAVDVVAAIKSVVEPFAQELRQTNQLLADINNVVLAQNGSLAVLNELKTLARGNNRLVMVAMNLSLMLAEQVLGGAARKELLEGAISDIDGAAGTAELIAQLDSAFAPPNSDEVDEEDESGNE